MAYVERECTLAGKVHWSGSKANVWGAALIVDSDKQFRYVSAWGKRGGKLDYALGLPESATTAISLFQATRAEKLAAGYTYDYDYLDLWILFDEITQKLTSMEKAEAQLVKNLSTSSSTAVYPETCGYCYFKDRPGSDPFWNAVCTICGVRAAFEHANSHPHNSAPGTKPCAQFSQTPDQWEALGWTPGMLKMQAHAAALSVPKPLIWTPKPDDEEHCPNCIVNKLPVDGLDAKDSVYALHCTGCKQPVGSHAWGHPHVRSHDGCNGVSFPPKAYELVGLKEPEQSKVAEPKDDCPLCSVNNRPSLSESTKTSFYRLACLDCGANLGYHGGSHPHISSSCGGASFPGVAYAKAMMKAPTRAVPPPSATTRRGAAESNPVDLPNLPCDCEHLWSYHASHSEVLASGIELATFACLLITCRCEAYRHTCPECGEQTRRTVRHKATCLTYERSQLLAEPSGDTPARKPRHQRLPRRISHLLLNDDD